MTSLKSLFLFLWICLFVIPLSHAATPTATTLAVTPSNALAAQQIATLTATVQSAGQPVSVGTVEFYDGKLYLGSVQVVRNPIHGYAVGTATLRTALSTGSHPLSAIFDPTAVYASSTSAGQTVTVSGAAAASTGTFSLGTPFPAGEPEGVYSADVDNNGYPDIVYLGFQDAKSFSLNLLINHGDGTFGGPINPLPPPSPPPPFNYDLLYGQGGGPPPVYADFNGDGVLDYAFDSNRDNVQTNIDDFNMVVNFGAGDGTYPTGLVLIPSPSSNTPRVLGSIATGDFNGDGIPDLIVTDLTVVGSPVLDLFTGKADGSFNSPITNPQMTGITSMMVRDFNRDGFADMAVTVAGQNAVLVLMGNGDGTYLPAVAYRTGNTPRLGPALQLRGNGVTDLAVLNSADNTLGILLGNGDGTFLAQGTYPLTVPTTAVPMQIVAADVTGDGLQDIVVRNGINTNSQSLTGSFSVLAGNGDGSFQPLIEYSSFPSYLFFGDLAAADFDRDGVADLAVSSGGGYTISILHSGLRPDPTFTFTASPSTLTIAAGKTGSTTLTLAPQNGFNGSVQLTCTGLPANSTCSFAPATLVATGEPLSTTLTITTNVAVAGLQPLAPASRHAAISFACLFGLLSLATLRSTRKRLKIQPSSLLVLAVAGLFAATFIAGCSRGSNSTPTPPVPQTPIGTSSVTVTAQTSGTNAISKASQLTVTITQ
jgi:Bacterial Ig-like domain (group 3)/FG-GAP-like repeat/FG-GAP repeat